MDCNIQRNEINNFWRSSAALRIARRNSKPPDEIAEHIDEIEVIAMHTESPALRARCKALLAEDRAAVAAATVANSG